ncbi:MAG: hypothetical protein EOM51_05025 [Clostridia bacterium]|nr:hypothetical protein [Clostridia bacterium]
MKFDNSANCRGKAATLLVSLLLIFGITVTGTLAYLFVSSGLSSNSFRAVNVNCEVSESFSGSSKSNVMIQNTGDIDAFVRAALVLTWEDDNGNAVNESASLADLNINLNTADWFCGCDGYYYCKTRLSPNGFTPVLVTSASVKTDCDGYIAGYHLNLQILSEAIQAEPEAAVNSAWTAVHLNGTVLEG